MKVLRIKLNDSNDNLYSYDVNDIKQFIIDDKEKYYDTVKQLFASDMKEDLTTRVNLILGSQGVGKTHLFSNLLASQVNNSDKDVVKPVPGTLISITEHDTAPYVALSYRSLVNATKNKGDDKLIKATNLLHRSIFTFDVFRKYIEALLISGNYNDLELLQDYVEPSIMSEFKDRFKRVNDAIDDIQKLINNFKVLYEDSNVDNDIVLKQYLPSLIHSIREYDRDEAVRFILYLEEHKIQVQVTTINDVGEKNNNKYHVSVRYAPKKSTQKNTLKNFKFELNISPMSIIKLMYGNSSKDKINTFIHTTALHLYNSFITSTIVIKDEQYESNGSISESYITTLEKACFNSYDANAKFLCLNHFYKYICYNKNKYSLKDLYDNDYAKISSINRAIGDASGLALFEIFLSAILFKGDLLTTYQKYVGNEVILIDALRELIEKTPKSLYSYPIIAYMMSSINANQDDFLNFLTSVYVNKSKDLLDEGSTKSGGMMDMIFNLIYNINACVRGTELKLIINCNPDDDKATLLTNFKTKIAGRTRGLFVMAPLKLVTSIDQNENFTGMCTVLLSYEDMDTLFRNDILPYLMKGEVYLQSDPTDRTSAQELVNKLENNKVKVYLNESTRRYTIICN